MASIYRVPAVGQAPNRPLRDFSCLVFTRTLKEVGIRFPHFTDEISETRLSNFPPNSMVTGSREKMQILGFLTSGPGPLNTHQSSVALELFGRK